MHMNTTTINKQIAAGMTLLASLAIAALIVVFAPHSSAMNFAYASDDHDGCKLEITKIVNVTSAKPGDVITYTIQYKNAGTAKCTGSGVRIEDTLSSKVAFQTAGVTQSAGVTQGYELDSSSGTRVPFYNAATGKLTWSAGEMAPGSTGWVSWNVKVKEPVACGSYDITNTARITSEQYAGATLHTATPSVWVTSNTVKTNIVNACAPQPVQVSCTADKSSLTTGEAVTYTAHATGGNGTYAYSWTGTDSLTGSNQTASKTYSSAGAKSATVIVTSNGVTATASCGTTVSAPVNDLAGSCMASATRVRVGQNVSWAATASGGTGSYVYKWSDAQSYFDSTWTTNTAYSTTGIKTNSVTITSGNQSITKTCSVEVYDDTPVYNTLVGSCAADDDDIDVDDSATWRASASGGTGSYTYKWTGDDGLNSTNRTVSKSYDTKGDKDAQVKITDSNGNTVTAHCDLNVRETEKDELIVSCKATPDTADIGERVTWKATAIGGDGDYEYSWSGDHGLAGSDRTESGSYDTAGTKHARVEVISGDGQTDSARCSMEVEEPQSTVTVYTNTDNTPASQVYLSQVPYTGPMDNLKMALYILSFFLWSGAVSYYILYRKYGNEALAMVTAKAGAIRDEFSDKLNSLRSFKMAKKSPEVVKAEAAVAARNEMLMKLWDRTN